MHADGSTIIREGHGTGEGRGSSPGDIHELALKAAETDATKRALATFGKPFGLDLYRNTRGTRDRNIAGPALNGNPRLGFHPDDTTPIPRPSRYYGRRQALVTREAPKTASACNPAPSNKPSNATGCSSSKGPTAPPAQHEASLIPAEPALSQTRIDKSTLTISEPKRLRDKGHLKFVASQPCLVCGRQPSDPHHLQFAQPRAIGLKVSDEFTVPLCRGHHRQLHQAGNEVAWWEDLGINALKIAEALWEEWRGKSQTDPRTMESDLLAGNK